MSLTPPLFTSAFADGPDITKLRPSDWNRVTGLLTTLLDGGATGSLPYRNEADATMGIAWLPDVAVGQVLVSGGVGAAPAWSATPTLTSLTLGAAGVLAWSNDLLLTRDAANVLALRNASATQKIRLGPAAAFVSLGDLGDGRLQLLNTAGTGSALRLIFGLTDVSGTLLRNDGGGYLSILRGDAGTFGGIAAAEFLVSNAASITTGSGDPEGVVSAPPGSIRLRTNGGASTTLYVKTSGTGNTGWTAK